MKLITWNVNHASSKATLHVEALRVRAPDVVALQDVRSKAIPVYEKAFERTGLSKIVHTLHDGHETPVSGVLVASRLPLTIGVLPDVADVIPEGVRTPDPDKIETHWRRRAQLVRVGGPTEDFCLFNVYITPGSHKERGPDGKRRKYRYIKLDLLSAVYHSLAHVTVKHRVLCGDFNTPQEEMATGKFVTWGYDWEEGGYRLRRPDQHAVEWNILCELAQYGMRDVYREFHKYGNAGSDDAISYLKTYNNERPDERRRYDHVFASLSLIVRSPRYLTELRGLGLSDHVPLEVVLQHGAAMLGERSASRIQGSS